MSSFRRRMVMAANANSPIGDYIQDGLVFHLDCADCDLTQNTWIDKKGGVSFVMSNISKDSRGGIIFNGTSSKGIASQSVPYAATISTIEVAVRKNGQTTAFILDPGSWGAIAYSFYRNDNAVCSIQSNFNILIVPLNGFIANSVHFYQSTSIINGNAGTIKTEKSFWSVANTFATIGMRSNNSLYFDGTIYQIRIYNRKLTTDEMIYNQQIDMRKYN